MVLLFLTGVGSLGVHWLEGMDERKKGRKRMIRKKGELEGRRLSTLLLLFLLPALSSFPHN